MITSHTVQKLIEAHKEILEVSERHGYFDLRFYYTAREDSNTLTILSKYKKCEPEFVFGNLNEVLSRILGTQVLVTTENSLSVSGSIIEKASSAPLTDMVKTINYFFDVLIPFSTDEEPNAGHEQKRAEMLRLWEAKESRSEQHFQHSEGAVKDSSLSSLGQQHSPLFWGSQGQSPLPEDIRRMLEATVQMLNERPEHWNSAKKLFLSSERSPSVSKGSALTS